MALKILLVTEYFFPKTTGGTELYVYNLAKALISFGNQVAVITCTDDEQDYEFDGIKVVGIPFNKDKRTIVIKEEIAPDNLQSFENAIRILDYDIAHFHTLTTSINLFHIEKAKQIGYPALLTSHIPGHICLRGDLVHRNKEVCDGVIKSQKCLSCFHLSRGIQFPLNHLSAALLKYGDYVVPFSDSAKNKKKNLLKLNSILDAIIVVSEWQKKMFLANGMDEKKIRLCRQALAPTQAPLQKKTDALFTIGFTGRVAKGKGLHLLLEALSAIDQDRFCLKVAAIPVQDEMPYFNQLKNVAKNFKNHVWLENLPNQEIAAFMASIDVLCIPSIWLETGPFVAYEAFAVGTPVLGSNSGGIRELIEENNNGWLFRFNDTVDLLEKIKFLIALYYQKGSLRIFDKKLRTSENMAIEMIETYEHILK